MRLFAITTVLTLGSVTSCWGDPGTLSNIYQQARPEAVEEGTPDEGQAPSEAADEPTPSEAVPDGFTPGEPVPDDLEPPPLPGTMVVGECWPDPGEPFTFCFLWFEQKWTLAKDSFTIDCRRTTESDDWSCVCQENRQDTASFQKPFDASLTADELLEQCGLSAALRTCFYSAKYTLAECRAFIDAG